MREVISRVNNINTIDRARVDTQLTTRARRRYNGVHLLCGANYRVNRTSLDAFCTAYASRFIDNNDVR